MAQQPESPETPGPKKDKVASKPSQTLGKWVDNLLGDKKAHERAAAKAAQRQRATQRVMDAHADALKRLGEQ